MQGFILFLQPVRDEDLWVHVLSEQELLRLYRFYGARHSVIAIGHKIDFCIQNNHKNIHQLRDILQLSFSWERDRHKRALWQNFMQLLHHHLKDTGHIDRFYYDLLNDVCNRMEKQNAMRSLCEAYTKILHFEGRVNPISHCFVCNAELKNKRCILVRSLLSICESCLIESGSLSSIKYSHDKDKIAYFLHNNNAMLLDDQEVLAIWKIISMGF